jgi:FtsZ-interacting cell division protein ZipA
MSSTAMIVLIVVVVAVVVALAAIAVPRSRRMRLRRKFGPEFDRLAAERGDPRAADLELAERQREHQALELRPLAQPDRERYAGAWTDAQESFIDDPQAAVRQAEQIIEDLLAEIGYPAQDRDQQLALASVDHADGLAEYRQGHELLHVNSQQDAADDADSTEALRQAMQHYRVFFENILDRSQQTATS